MSTEADMYLILREALEAGDYAQLNLNNGAQVGGKVLAIDQRAITLEAVEGFYRTDKKNFQPDLEFSQTVVPVDQILFFSKARP